MTTKNFKDELLNGEQLDLVAGGEPADRGLATLWFRAHYDINGGKNGQIMDFVHTDFDTVLKRFCAKAGVEYQMNHNESDLFKINGQWRDIGWIISNREETLAFFDKKLGIR